MNTHQILKPKLIYGTPSGSRKSPKKWSQSVLLASLNFGVEVVREAEFFEKKNCVPKFQKWAKKVFFEFIEIFVY